MNEFDVDLLSNIYVTNNDHTLKQYQEFANYIMVHGLERNDEFIGKNIFINHFLYHIDDIIITEQEQFTRVVPWEIYGDCKNFYPDLNLVKAGRLNPEGVGYLYLGNNENTSVMEAKLSKEQFFYIGWFMPKRKLRLLDFSCNRKDEESEENSYKLILDKMFSKPINANDDKRKYLPTQFIAKLIIDKGYDGIKYSSSIQKDGYNLCVFNCNDMECIKYESRKINESK